MKFKFASFAPLVAACAVIATPVAAFAQTTPQSSTRYPQTMTQSSPNRYPRTNMPQNYPDTFQSPTPSPRTTVSQTVPNYIGLGGSNRGVALESKYALNNRFSVRPMAIGDLDSGNEFGDFSVPITYDLQPFAGLSRLHPYAGAGIGASTRGDDNFGAVLTTGADYPINNRLTANANATYDVFGNNDLNAVVGVAANFQ